MPSEEYLQRFAGLSRVFGESALEPLLRAHFCIVGIGGGGFWAAGGCGRAGVWDITLIRYDELDINKNNTQPHNPTTGGGHPHDGNFRQRNLAV